MYHFSLLPEAMSLKLKGSGKPSRKQTLKRNEVKVKGQQMSGRESSQGAESHKNYILCSDRSATDLPDKLDIFIIRTTHTLKVSIIVAGDVLPNTLTHVTVLYEKHAEENTAVSNGLQRSHDLVIGSLIKGQLTGRERSSTDQRAKVGPAMCV